MYGLTTACIDPVDRIAAEPRIAAVRSLDACGALLPGANPTTRLDPVTPVVAHPVTSTWEERSSVATSLGRQVGRS